MTVAGALLGAVVLTIVGAHSMVRAASEAGTIVSSVTELLAARSGLLCPIALVIALVVLPLALLVEPEGRATIVERVAALRARPPSRALAAALAPLILFAIFFTVLGAAHLSRILVAVVDVSESGLVMGLATVALAIFAAVTVIGLLPWVWMLTARAGFASPVGEPLVTGGLTLLVIVVLTTLGIVTGDPGGAGGLPGIGLLGVLSRPELDLRGVGYSAFLAACAYLGGVAARHRVERVGRFVGAGVIALLLMLLVRTSWSLGDAPSVAVTLEAHAPLASVSLKILRRLTDRDHDGHSARFGGADCNDADPRINPTAVDIPGNGIDEDCSGEDTPAPAPRPVIARAPDPDPTQAPAAPARTYNVVFFTVDTLRYDLGFAGYPKPVTRNLDALAAKSTVFERAYSLSSYTAKSMGSMMIGRYPSETLRDYEHFTTYYTNNVFVAERARDAGVFTFAGHCHYYFRWNTGYAQGFDGWDTSAIPQGMGDNDSSITSDRLSDLALRMLARPENVTPAATGEGPRRFFAWFHYFDPHAQYVRHAGAPAFASMPGGTDGRAVYDEEVWFTDKHIGRVLDYIASQPWGADTAIILTADHGEAFGDHGVKTHGHELYEPLVRVPLILYVPGMPARKVSIKRSAIDIAPTIVDLVGAKAGPDLRGASLLRDVRAAAGAPLDERDIYLDMPQGPYNDVRRAIITGPSPGMKLMHFGGKRYELYDLAKDEAELKDLSREPETLAPVMTRLQELRGGLEEVSVGGGKR